MLINLLSILRSGFTPINTPSYPIIGPKSTLMFGPGVYTTDESSKALYYANGLRFRCTSNNKDKFIGFLLLCDLDVGQVYNASKGDISPVFKLDSQFDSLYADPKIIGIPSFVRSERVVYDPSRVICRYLLHIECNV